MTGPAATAAGWFSWQGMWDASIPTFDGEIRRRPYHRNCRCALHRSRALPADIPCPNSSVSYPSPRRSSSWHPLTFSSNLAAAAAAAESSPLLSLDAAAAAVSFTVESSFSSSIHPSL